MSKPILCAPRMIQPSAPGHAQPWCWSSPGRPNAPRGNWLRSDLQQLRPNPFGYLACAIKDSGLGISVKDQGELFTQFFRSNNEEARKQPGTGLGLSITKSLIELQGGAIWVESELGKGSTFAFSMPVSADGVREPTG